MIRLLCEERNEVAGLDRFLRTWDAEKCISSEIEDVDHAPRSMFGNINIGAQPWTAPSLMLSRGHTEFFRHIEPGVRAWVRWFVERGHTTYTSCEGHFYGPQSDADYRHVGVLLRADRQLEVLVEAYESVELSSELHCCLAYLSHSVLAGDLRLAALDLFLIPAPDATSKSYFCDLDRSMTSMLAQLEAR